jgi:hypothetical protein
MNETFCNEYYQTLSTNYTISKILSEPEKTVLWDNIRKFSARIPTLLCRIEEEDLRKPKKN